MFKELYIKNFKSIGKAKFDLGKINVLTGPSNLGKSNVVQAIYCLVHNHWDSNYLKWGEKKCSIKLVDESGEFVEYQHDSSATYILSTCEQPFTKIGKNVPTEVQEFLKMNLVQFDEDLELDFNFERQFDPSFVISLSGFELAKVFGKLMNLDIVMSASRNISKDIMGLNRKKDSLNAIQDVSINYIHEHYDIELKYALLHTAIDIDEKIEKTESYLNELRKLIEEFDYYSAVSTEFSKFIESDEIKNIDSIVEPIPGLFDIIVEVEQLSEKSRLYQEEVNKTMPEIDLNGLVGVYNLLVESCLANEQKVAYLKVLDSSLAGGIDFTLVDKLYSLIDLLNQMNGFAMILKNTKKDYSIVNNSIETKMKEFSEYIHENNICPITNLPFAESCMKQILSTVE